MSSTDAASSPSALLTPTAVLVVGAGRAAAFIFKALASPHYRSHFTLSALVRPTTDEKKLTARATLQSDYHVRLIEGDLTLATPDLASLLHGQHTVISTTSFLSPVEQQLSLLQACVAAGVQRFIPSDFGPDWAAFPDPNPISVTQQSKMTVQKAVEASGLDWLNVICGFFYHLTIHPFAGVDLTHLTITAPRSFDSRLTATDTDDVGLVLAEALLRNEHRQHIRMAGQTFTWQRLADVIDEEAGVKLERQVASIAEIDEKLAADGEGVLMWKFKFIQARECGTWWDEADTHNRRYGLQLKGLRKYVREQVNSGALKVGPVQPLAAAAAEAQSE